MNARAAVEELIYGAALRLDAGDFAGFLALCAPGFRYSIGAFSPEIRREMLWLDLDKEGLRNLFETLPRHNSDRAPLARHVTVYTVSARNEGSDAEIEVVSALQVFRTDLDGGASALFAVGKIHDHVGLTGGELRLGRRHIKLATRLLGIGSHIPF